MNKKLSYFVSAALSLFMALEGYFNAKAADITGTSKDAINAEMSTTATNIYYVSTTGNDGNPGTLEAPFQTITKGMNAALAEDIVYVRAGTYPGFAISKSGITIAGYNGEMPVILGGTGIRCTNKTDVTIKGFEVTGATGNYTGAITLSSCNNTTVEGNKIHDNISFSVSGVGVLGINNKILNNEIYNNNFSGIRVTGVSSSNELAFNRIYNHTLSAGNSDGISLAHETVTMTNIHDNVVFNNSDDGIDTWTSSQNTIMHNTVYGSGGTGNGNGFKLGGGATGGNNIVIGNISYSNMYCGFTSNGNGNYYEGNTSHDNASCGFDDSYRGSGDTKTSSFINNTAYNNPAGNFKKSSYTTVFLGNSESASGTVIASVTPTATNTTAPVVTPTPTNTTDPVTPTPTSTMVSPATPTTIPAVTDTAPAPETVPTITLPSATPSPTMTMTPIPMSPTAEIAPTMAATETPVPPLPTITELPPVNPTIIVPAAPTIPAEIPNQPIQETVYDDKDGAFVYSGGWEDVSHKKAYNGSFKQATRKDPTVTLKFTGQSFSIVYEGSPAFRKMDVYLDNSLVGTINQRAKKPSFQLRWDYPGQFAYGNHTLKLVFVTPNKSNKNTGSFDAVIVR